MQESQYQYHVDGAKPARNEIFVFGSNLKGVHGAGAAKAAHKFYHAEWGIAYGLTGGSFAIPTKDRNIETMPLVEIEPYVTTFLMFASSQPDMKFFMTRIGCGLAGYTDADIAPMFVGAPSNINFPENWRSFLEQD